MSNIREKHFRNVEDFFAEGLLVMRGKNEDYAEDSDPFSNFRFAAEAAGITVEQVFLCLQGIKLARLRTLLVNNKAPQNESVDDTISDASNYYAIQSSYSKLKNSTDPDYAYAAAPEEEQNEDFLLAEEPDFTAPLAAEDPVLSPVEKLKQFLHF